MTLEKIALADAPIGYFNKHYGINDQYIVPQLPTAHFNNELRIAVFGDICANVNGLTACYEDAKKQVADIIIINGNIVGIGPHHNATIDYLDDIAAQHPLLITQGPSDDAIVRQEKSSFWPTGNNEKDKDTRAQYLRQSLDLAPKNKAFLAQLNPHTGLFLTVKNGELQYTCGFFHTPPCPTTQQVNENGSTQNTVQFKSLLEPHDRKEFLLQAAHASASRCSVTENSSPGHYIKTVCNLADKIAVMTSPFKGGSGEKAYYTRPTCWPSQKQPSYAYLLMTISKDHVSEEERILPIAPQALVRLMYDVMHYYAETPQLAGHIIGDMITKKQWEQDNQSMLATICAQDPTLSDKNLQQLIQAISSRW